MSRLLPLAVGVSMLSGCATLTVQKDKVAAVKRVAIVGYGGQLQLEDQNQKKGLAGTIGAIKGANDLFSGKMAERRREQATHGYAELGKRTGATLGWELVAPEAVAAVPEYAQALGAAGSMWKGGGYQYVEGILPPAHASRMSQQARQQLAGALGVDALAVVEVSYVVGDRGGFAIGGMGSTTVFPKAIIRFTVFDKDAQEIWRDTYAVGAVAKNALRTTMGADIVENESEVINEATELGIDALLARYASHQAAEAK